jgi:hypothetical protein
MLEPEGSPDGTPLEESLPLRLKGRFMEAIGGCFLRKF